MEQPPQAPEQDEDASALVEYLPDAIPVLSSDLELRRKLLQWNLSDRLKLLRFRVARRTASEEEELTLIRDFFRVDAVRQLLDLPADKSTEFEPGWRRLLSDLLREMLVSPDSQHSDLFSRDEEQEEFIFQLFRALVIGGSMCQSDDSIHPYEDATRALYKALVSVKKRSGDPTAVDVTSRVYAVDPASGSGGSLFSTASPLHTCFVVLDPKKRRLTVWLHPFVPFCLASQLVQVRAMALGEEEAAVTTRFLNALVETAAKQGGDAAEVAYMVDRLVPVLVPGLVHLLKAVAAAREREEDGGEDVEPVNALNHLAGYLYRHNPRFGEPEEDVAQLQAIARKALSK